MPRIGTVPGAALRRQTPPIKGTDRFSITPAGLAALEDVQDDALKDALRARQADDGPADDRPRPEVVRGICPQCAAPVVANCYFTGASGYKVIHECWESLGSAPKCGYRRVL